MRSTMLFVFAVILLGNNSHAQDFQKWENSSEVTKIKDRAVFEFSNELMYKDQDRWIGQIVSFQGSFLQRTDILKAGTPFEQITGRSNQGDPVDVIAFLDTPIESAKDFGDTRRTIVKGQPVRIFGIVRKCREVVTRTGVVKILPTLELLLVYTMEDQTFSYPLWISKEFRRP